MNSVELDGDIPSPESWLGLAAWLHRSSVQLGDARAIAAEGVAGDWAHALPDFARRDIVEAHANRLGKTLGDSSGSPLNDTAADLKSTKRGSSSVGNNNKDADVGRDGDAVTPESVLAYALALARCGHTCSRGARDVMHGYLKMYFTGYASRCLATLPKQQAGGAGDER